MDPSRTPLMSSTVARSVKKGQRSVNSVSWGSLNQVETGTAFVGWKMYDAGELSIMMQSSMARPSCERSCDISSARMTVFNWTHLDVVALVVVATLAEETMTHNAAYIEHIKHGVGVLHAQPCHAELVCRLTFEREAVKMTTSYILPISVKK